MIVIMSVETVHDFTLSSSTAAVLVLAPLPYHLQRQLRLSLPSAA